MTDFAQFHQEKKITQPEDQPSRRKFSDHKHFDLTVWYKEKAFETIAGFQLSYRENPFNTDDEYFITQLPDKDESQIEHAKSAGDGTDVIPSSKLMEDTDKPPPPSMHGKYMEVGYSLPDEIQTYLHGKLSF